MPKRDEFTHPRFILAEGHEDASFARALIQHRGLPPFDVSPNEDVGSVSGNSGFGDAIIDCEGVTGFEAVSDVVFLADNDSNPADSFQDVRGQIEKAHQENNLDRNWGQAAEPLAKAEGDPSVSIWMWPSANQPGCLETLLWKVLQSTSPMETACADAACQCSSATNWSVSKLDKARVRCFLSLVCRRNPAIALANVWRDAPELIPLGHAELDPFAHFLSAI